MKIIFLDVDGVLNSQNYITNRNALHYTCINNSASAEIDFSIFSLLIKANTDIPAAIGFGISTPEQAVKMAEIADGVIVGSAIVKICEEHKENAPKYIGRYVKEMKDAIR